ncbi:MAG: carbon-nitrogen hydrolase family protein [Myxococcota bacterium]
MASRMDHVRSTRVAVAQLTSGVEVEKNLDAVERCVLRAADQGAEVLVLPECFAFLGPSEKMWAIAESLPHGGPILARCANLARTHQLEMVLGGYWERSSIEGKVHNACIHLDRDGAVQSVYRKIHLFDVDLPDGTRLIESAHVEAGQEVVVAEMPFGKLGLSICYDLRFPELYRELVDRGAVAFAVPAAFTLTTGKDHWHVLLRSRAIEQQCYVLAAAQTGSHFGSRVSYGHALIADPWGTVLAQCGEGEGIAVAALEPDVVGSIRNALPSLKHRKMRPIDL